MLPLYIYYTTQTVPVLPVHVIYEVESLNYLVYNRYQSVVVLVLVLVKLA